MNLFAWDSHPSEPINPAKPQRELRALAKTIDRTAADILALQEVGSRQALIDLNSLLKNPYPHIQLAHTNSDRGIHLGYLSRSAPRLHSHRHLELHDADGNGLKDLARPQSLKASKLRLQRDISVAEFRISSTTLLIVNVHLKSHGHRAWQTLSPLTIRTAECRALVHVLDSLAHAYPPSPVVVLGDFNDSPLSSAFEPLAKLRGGTLYDPVMRELVPVNPRISTYWPKRRSRVDRILLNSHAKSAYVAGSIRLWSGNTAEIASDHFPLSIALQY
jgi:endonuclease/exonuclease/phosphatase family metal-dependent hydrolase